MNKVKRYMEGISEQLSKEAISLSITAVGRVNNLVSSSIIACGLITSSPKSMFGQQLLSRGKRKSECSDGNLYQIGLNGKMVTSLGQVSQLQKLQVSLSIIASRLKEKIDLHQQYLIHSQSPLQQLTISTTLLGFKKQLRQVNSILKIAQNKKNQKAQRDRQEEEVKEKKRRRILDNLEKIRENREKRMDIISKSKVKEVPLYKQIQRNYMIESIKVEIQRNNILEQRREKLSEFTNEHRKQHRSTPLIKKKVRTEGDDHGDRGRRLPEIGKRGHRKITQSLMNNVEVLLKKLAKTERKEEVMARRIQQVRVHTENSPNTEVQNQEVVIEQQSKKVLSNSNIKHRKEEDSAEYLNYLKDKLASFSILVKR